MLTIVCGEDTIASREYFMKLKQDYLTKKVDVSNVLAKEILNQITQSSRAQGLFTDTTVFFTEHLNSFLVKTKDKRVTEEFEKIAKSKDIEIVVWEEATSRDLKISKLTRVKEFKPQKNIFQLLDACHPGNKSTFIDVLEKISEYQDEFFIFTMLTRHTRTLILARKNKFSSRVQSWQKGKLTSQAKKWEIDHLVGFYEGLSRIDQSIKISSTPFGAKESLDILACYFL